MDDSTRTVSKATMEHYCLGLAILEALVQEYRSNLHDSTDAMGKALGWVARDKARTEASTLATAGVE